MRCLSAHRREVISPTDTGHLMIQSVSIKNFRCYQDVSLAGLSRINLVVGDSGSGKTALLESLFLCASRSPGNAFRLRTWRGAGGAFTVTFGGSTAELFSDLFRDFDCDNSVKIEVKGTDRHSRVFEAYRTSPTSDTVNLENPSDSELIQDFEFAWTNDRGERSASTPKLKPDGQLSTDGFPGTTINGKYLHTADAFASDVALMFGKLDQMQKSQPIVDAMASEYPMIEAIAPLPDATGQAALYATVKGVQRKMPIGFVSGGFARTLGYLLSVASFPGGVLYIDEVESGIYYDRQVSLWSLLLKMATTHKVQIFATTHSLECIRAAAEVAKSDVGSFSFIRTERSDSGVSTAKLFDGQQFLDAVTGGVEVR